MMSGFWAGVSLVVLVGLLARTYSSLPEGRRKDMAWVGGLVAVVTWFSAFAVNQGRCGSFGDFLLWWIGSILVACAIIASGAAFATAVMVGITGVMSVAAKVAPSMGPRPAWTSAAAYAVLAVVVVATTAWLGSYPNPNCGKEAPDVDALREVIVLNAPDLVDDFDEALSQGRELP